MGKGDGRRPTAVPEQTFQDAWDRVFGTKKRPGVAFPVSSEQPSQDSDKHLTGEP